MNTISTTTSRDECVLNDIALRNQLIVEMLDEVGGMVSNFACKYRMDFDDCIQHASLLMLEVYPKIPAGYKVRAYLNATVRRGLYLMLKGHIDYTNRAFSLEMARDEDGTTLADMLEVPATLTETEIQHLEKVTEAVHDALRQCRLEEQEYACKTWKLDYIPVEPINHPMLTYPNKKDKPRRTDHMRKSIQNVFRKHPQVLGLIQRETCVL